MRIEIVQQINEETREVWCFNMFNLTAVFTSWTREIKPEGKRKWVIDSYWDKYARSGQKISSEPELTEIIKSKAIDEILKYIKVSDWNTWKSKC